MMDKSLISQYVNVKANQEERPGENMLIITEFPITHLEKYFKTIFT
jgi:hypothetical protein